LDWARAAERLVREGQVQIFDDIISPKLVWPVEARWPLRRAQALIERFRARFPGIDYDLFWETRLLNAQAFRGPKGRCVRLYGGLGRHRRIGVEGLAFAMAHETGHHLGGAPRHPYYVSMSSEERANEWAVTDGLPAVFDQATAQRYAVVGWAQLSAVWSRYSKMRLSVPKLQME
jgi:Zn-dependent protease with chaperone function